jgi:uncharacterized C2H2 Zn-finger protein
MMPNACPHSTMGIKGKDFYECGECGHIFPMPFLISVTDEKGEAMKAALISVKQSLLEIEDVFRCDPIFKMRKKLHEKMHAKIDAALSTATDGDHAK